MIWEYSDQDGDTVSLVSRTDGEYYIEVIAPSLLSQLVYVPRAELLDLYHAIGEELIRTGACDLPGEPVT